ncbi:MAG: hypothetical protein SNJ70_00540 [Armatimonadota bacterium]
MPRIKSNKTGTKTNESAKLRDSRLSSVSDTYQLMSIMLEYESAASKTGLDLATGRFKMLTSAERQFLRAELIADFIRLSVGNMGNTPGYYDHNFPNFCNKICDLELPSHELMGTFLAAIELATMEEPLKEISGIQDAMRKTILEVLSHCVDILKHRSEKLAA